MNDEFFPGNVLPNEEGKKIPFDSAIYPDVDFAKTDTYDSFKELRLDPEFYKRAGFYCALNEKPATEFRQTIINLQRHIRLQIDRLKKECANDIERFNERRSESKNKIAELKTLIKMYVDELSELESVLPDLEKRFETAQEKIKSAVIEIGNKKETLIKDRQKSLLEELDQLQNELEALVKRRMAMNEDIFLKQKAGLDQKRDFWQKLFEKYEVEHKRVLAKLELFGLTGFHSLSSAFVYNIGLIAAAAAGAFFAFFAETNYFASGGIPSFIIQNLFNFSTQFLGQNLNTPLLDAAGKKAVFAGILLLIFLTLFGLILVVSWICHQLYRRVIEAPKDELPTKKAVVKSENGEDEQTSFAIELNLENQDIPIKTRITEKSFLGFWIKITPSLLCLAIFFILVSLGTDVNNLKSLDASIAGYGVGFMIALACAGVVYLYLTMITERRLERQKKKSDEEGENKISWFWVNFELVLFVLSFIAAVLIILLVFQHPFKTLFQVQSLASLILFSLCAIATALTLGVGVRLQSLETARELLEINCGIIQNKIIRISKPWELYLLRKENAQFNYKFLQVRDAIMNLMLLQTKLTRNAIATPLISKRRNNEKSVTLSRLANWWRNNRWRQRFSSKENKPTYFVTTESTTADVFYTASEEIRVCFPKLEAELGTLENDANRIREELESTKREIAYRKEQKGEFYTAKLREVEEQENRFINYHKAIANREKDFHKNERYLIDSETIFVQKLVEGFELGDWFAKNNPIRSVIPEKPLNT